MSTFFNWYSYLRHHGLRLRCVLGQVSVEDKIHTHTHTLVICRLINTQIGYNTHRLIMNQFMAVGNRYGISSFSIAPHAIRHLTYMTYDDIFYKIPPRQLPTEALLHYNLKMRCKRARLILSESTLITLHCKLAYSRYATTVELILCSEKPNQTSSDSSSHFGPQM